MHEPIAVSVIIPVWNAEAYLTDCLDSVVAQTIGLDQLQVLAVDDGSTDSSGAILDDYAAHYPQVTAVHEASSGGPGRPRNIGLQRARGTYVFFLDADDYLGPEALERLVAMAERCRSDIVLGKMVGIGGRKVPDAFRRTLARARIDEVYKTLSVLKLFRRSLIDRLGLRFEEGLSGHEDSPFTIRAYFEASRISVLADYDCYYVRPSSRTRPPVEPGRYLRAIEEQRMRVVAHYRPPGMGRDRLMARHVREVVSAFRESFLACSMEDRRRVFDAGSDIIRRWHTDRIQRRLPAWAAVRARCLQQGLRTELEDIVAFGDAAALAHPIVERGRVYAGYPHFRDAAGIPDRDFDVTPRLALTHRLREAEIDGRVLRLAGDGALTPLGGTTSIVLRRWPLGPAFWHASMPTQAGRLRSSRSGLIAYTSEIELDRAADGRPLPRGSWDVLVSIGIDRVRRQRRIRVPPEASVLSAATASSVDDDRPRIRLDVTPVRTLRLRVGPVAPWMRWLEIGEAGVDHALRLVARATTGTRPGRLLAHVLRARWPDRIG